MKGKILVVSTILALLAFAALLSTVHASLVWQDDVETGTYTTVEAYVSGNYVNGVLSSPNCYVKATITSNLPSPFVLNFYWYITWTDTSHNVHTYYNTTAYNLTQAGQSVTINAKDLGLPTQVLSIYAEGRAGYDGTWDTPYAIAGIPYN